MTNLAAGDTSVGSTSKSRALRPLASVAQDRGRNNPERYRREVEVTREGERGEGERPRARFAPDPPQSPRKRSSAPPSTAPASTPASRPRHPPWRSSHVPALVLSSVPVPILWSARIAPRIAAPRPMRSLSTAPGAERLAPSVDSSRT